VVYLDARISEENLDYDQLAKDMGHDRYSMLAEKSSGSDSSSTQSLEVGEA